MKRYCSILLEATDMSEEDLRGYVSRMMWANEGEPVVDVRIRAAYHEDCQEVISTKRLKRLEKALLIINNINNFKEGM